MPAVQTPRFPSGLEIPLHPFELHGLGFEPHVRLVPVVPVMAGADNVIDEGAEEIGEPVLRIMRSAPMTSPYSIENESTYPEDVFSLAKNAPLTPPPTAPPMTKTRIIMQRNQKAVGRKPQTRRELEFEEP